MKRPRLRRELLQSGQIVNVKSGINVVSCSGSSMYHYILRKFVASYRFFCAVTLIQRFGAGAHKSVFLCGPKLQQSCPGYLQRASAVTNTL